MVQKKQNFQIEMISVTFLKKYKKSLDLIIKIWKFLMLSLFKNPMLTIKKVEWSTHSFSVMFDRHLIIPWVISKMMHLHMLPIDSDHFSLFDVADCWHLEWEELLIWWSFKLVEFVDVAGVFIDIDEVVILAELSIESSNNHEFTSWELAHTCSLSGCDHVVRVLCSINWNSLPFIIEICKWKLHSFKWRRVFLVCILNTTKNVDKFIVEVCTWVIMSSFIDLSKFHPFINLSIIDLNSWLSLIDFFSGTTDQNVSIGDCAARVAMSCKLHLFLFFKFILETVIASQFFELSALEHGIWQSFIVSTSNHKNLWVDVTNLDHLEIVWKVASEINWSVAQLFWVYIKTSDCLWIFLEDV